MRIQLKNKAEIFSDKSKDFHLTYGLKIWGLLRIIYKFEVLLENDSDTMIGIQIQWEYNWNGSGDTFY